MQTSKLARRPAEVQPSAMAIEQQELLLYFAAVRPRTGLLT
jgi:hypothetical protein